MDSPSNVRTGSTETPISVSPLRGQYVSTNSEPRAAGGYTGAVEENTIGTYITIADPLDHVPGQYVSHGKTISR